MAASSGKKSSRSKKSRSSSARSSKSSKSSLWRQIKTIGISIIVVYWLASCFTFGVSDFEIFDEGHWVTAKARAEKVAAFTAEHPEAFIMDVWGFGDRTKINPVIASADSGVRVWCINSHEVTKTAAEAAQKLCKTTKSGPTTIAIYGGNFANVDFSTNIRAWKKCLRDSTRWNLRIVRASQISAKPPQLNGYSNMLSRLSVI